MRSIKGNFRPVLFSLAVMLLGALFLAGCATQGYVQQQIAAVDGKIGKLTSEVAKIGDLEKKVASHDQKIAALEGKVDSLTKSVDMLKSDVAKALAATVVKEPSLMKTSTVNFGFNKSKLTPEAAKSLADVVAQIKKTKNYQIVVEGHTDYVGSEGYNYKLGAKRSSAVLRYLVANGVNLTQTSLISWGEDQPIATNKDKKGRAQNRRVEIKLYGIAEK